MFTGVVEATGEIVSLVSDPLTGRHRLKLRSGLSASQAIGSSLALNGACLSVVGNSGGELSFDLLEETLQRTNLGDLRVGDLINLERPLAANGRFDGHIVQGHVDATGTIAALEAVGADHRLLISYPEQFNRYLIFKGSIAVNGISLTLSEVSGTSMVIWIIPHTWQVTNLARSRVGDRVNLEFDLIAKYVEKLLTHSNT
jgi:riboflavin synthase